MTKTSRKMIPIGTDIGHRLLMITMMNYTNSIKLEMALPLVSLMKTNAVMWSKRSNMAMSYLKKTHCSNKKKLASLWGVYSETTKRTTDHLFLKGLSLDTKLASFLSTSPGSCRLGAEIRGLLDLSAGERTGEEVSGRTQSRLIAWSKGMESL